MAQPPGRSPNYQQILLDRGLTESQLANPLVQAAIGDLGSAGDDHNTVGISASFRNEFEPNQFAGWWLAAERRRGLQQIRVGIGTIAAGYCGSTRPALTLLLLSPTATRAATTLIDGLPELRSGVLPRSRIFRLRPRPVPISSSVPNFSTYSTAYSSTIPIRHNGTQRLDK